MKKLVYGSIIVFVLFLLIPSVIGKDYEIIEEDFEEQFYDLPFDIKNNISDPPPVVEILNPSNGSILNDNQTNLSIKVSDNIGVFRVFYKYISFEGSQGGGFILPFEPNPILFINETIEAHPGYNLYFVVAFDEYGNMGYDFVFYFYETPDRPFPKGDKPSTKFIYPVDGMNIDRKTIDVSSISKDDNVGIEEYYACGIGIDYSWGFGHGNVKEYTYFFNNIVNVSHGHNVYFSLTQNYNGVIKYDLVLAYFNSSNVNTSEDVYPPKITVQYPRKGLSIMCNDYTNIPIRFPMVIGAFGIWGWVSDTEGNLEDVSIYIDDKFQIHFDETNIYDYDFFDWPYGYQIWWYRDGFLFGVHDIKIVATDSYGNVGINEFKCFIINIL